MRRLPPKSSACKTFFRGERQTDPYYDRLWFFMTRKDAIIARRSVRTYTEEPLKDNQLLELRKFIGTIHPLHASIKININILSRADFAKNYRTTFSAKAAHYLVIRSVKKEGWLENAGFIGQQIMLYLTEHDIGSCWLGMVSPKNESAGQLPYVITICFGRADNSPMRRSPDEANRKLLHELVIGKISHPSLLDLLNAGRLAPSSMNSQPVRYITESTNIYVYRKRPLISINKLEDMQCIDVGTAMANIFVASDGKRIFVKEKNYPTPPSNCIYEYTALEYSEDMVADHESEE